jgi:hypothetical protein
MLFNLIGLWSSKILFSFCEFINFRGVDTERTRSLRRCVKKEKCNVTDQYMLNNKYANVETKGQNVYLHYSTECFHVQYI